MPPTLILHGDKDPIVTVDNAYDLKRLFDEKKITYEMHIYPGEEHGFGGEALTDSVKRMIAFFDKHL
jgi:dipeptidyl aminopeptidase/acylaminoacyl peptidase